MPYSHSSLKIGFVPLVDCAPLVLAKELGYFKEERLRVDLVREPGWATIRDKVAHGEIDAAHALAGLCFAISWGLGVLARPCVTGFLFNSHGDAITLSKRLFDAGAQDAHTFAAHLKSQSKGRKLTFGIPHPFSSHHFLLRHWLRSGGLDPQRDVDTVTLPPSQMISCLEAGYLDGFCVGEPFNTEAILRGLGSVAVTSVDLVPMHPEKALLVPAAFAEQRADEHGALIRALAKACLLCDTPEGREEAANILSRRPYLDVDKKVLRASLSSDRPEFHLFHGPDVNRPSVDKANWLVNQMRLAGMLDGLNRATVPSVTEIFREDLYQSIGLAPTLAEITA